MLAHRVRFLDLVNVEVEVRLDVDRSIVHLVDYVFVIVIRDVYSLDWAHELHLFIRVEVTILSEKMGSPLRHRNFILYQSKLLVQKLTWSVLLLV